MKLRDARFKIGIECTNVFLQPWIQAGIQRVVRNIARESATADKTFGKIVPLALGGNQTYEVVSLLGRKSVAEDALNRVFSISNRARALAASKLKASRNPKQSSIRTLLFKAIHVMSSVSVAVQIAIRKSPFQLRARPAYLDRGDTLVLLDATWRDPELFRQIAKLKAEGVRVVAVVYDLIPIRHGGFCERELVNVFTEWFEKMVELAEAFVCISESVCQQVQNEVQQRFGETKMREKAYGWFHLGSDLDRKTPARVVGAGIRECFVAQNATFLVVGTIEPRKNHTLILDAFDRHWASGGEATLCVIGRKGWMCDVVVARLRNHPEKDQKLFWFDDANDNDLDFAYQNADALVFASFVEGFGLPLVEGLQRGLPAIASDIPVFREVAGDFAEYFDPNSASDLCAIIDQFSVTKKLPNARPVTEWKWITWKESAQQLFNAVDRCCRELDERA